MNDEAKDRPKAKRQPITIREMAYVCADIGARKEESQRALVKSELRKEPYEPEMREALVLRTTAHFLDQLRPHMTEIRRIISYQPYSPKGG